MKLVEQDNETMTLVYWNESLDKYVVRFSCLSLIWLENANSPSFSNRHELELYLHKDYPRTPPQLTWLTNIFHPNILPPNKNGGVCIGSWAPSETLGQLCLRIIDILQYKNYSITDALDKEAAVWIKEHEEMFPLADS